jgi:hypothetical protein
MLIWIAATVFFIATTISVVQKATPIKDLLSFVLLLAGLGVYVYTGEDLKSPLPVMISTSIVFGRLSVITIICSCGSMPFGSIGADCITYGLGALMALAGVGSIFQWMVTAVLLVSLSHLFCAVILEIAASLKISLFTVPKATVEASKVKSK